MKKSNSKILPKHTWRTGDVPSHLSYELMNCVFKKAKFMGIHLYSDKVSDKIKFILASFAADEFSYEPNFNMVERVQLVKSITSQINFHTSDFGGNQDDSSMRQLVRKYVYNRNKY